MDQMNESQITLGDIAYKLCELKNYPDILPEQIDEFNFFGNAILHTEKSHSQFFQDLWVLYETKFKKGGFFVDFGATDGNKLNNTYILEKQYGWNGIVSEPNPAYKKRLYGNRSCTVLTDCVYTRSGETVNFLVTDEPYLSTIEGYGEDDEHCWKRKDSNEIELTTISLYDMLEQNNAPNDIDYLSIDTEGSEYDILRAFFDDNRRKKYNIKCITVEQNISIESLDLSRTQFVSREQSYTREALKIQELLEVYEYTKKFENFSGIDGFYVKDEK